MFKFLKKFMNVELLRFVLLITLCLISVESFAADGTTVTIGTVQTHITKAVGDIAGIIMDVSTIAGAGFVFASFFKFHQHKQQPTQVPLSNGVVLLLIGAALCVFPHIIGTGSEAIFGKGVTRAGSGDIQKIVGGTTGS